MSLHPMLTDRIESERCPDCGIPGAVIGRPAPGLVEMACPDCEPALTLGGAA